MFHDIFFRFSWRLVGGFNPCIFLILKHGKEDETGVNAVAGVNGFGTCALPDPERMVPLYYLPGKQIPAPGMCRKVREHAREPARAADLHQGGGPAGLDISLLEVRVCCITACFK